MTRPLQTSSDLKPGSPTPPHVALVSTITRYFTPNPFSNRRSPALNRFVHLARAGAARVLGAPGDHAPIGSEGGEGGARGANVDHVAFSGAV